MCKYVYPDTNKPVWRIKLKAFELEGVTMNLKSAYPTGRIIADGNLLEGL